MPFSAEVGGEGLEHPVTATAVAIEELAYHSSSIAAVFDVHCILAGNVLTHGTEAQQQQWLRPVADGTMVGAFATTEPEASSDLSPQAVQTVAVRHGDTWVLNGRKRSVLGAGEGDDEPGDRRIGDPRTACRCSSSTPHCRAYGWASPTRRWATVAS